MYNIELGNEEQPSNFLLSESLLLSLFLPSSPSCRAPSCSSSCPNRKPTSAKGGHHHPSHSTCYLTSCRARGRELVWGRELGRGAYGTVSLCTWDKRKPPEEVAVKVVPKRKILRPQPEWKRGIEWLKALNHPHVSACRPLCGRTRRPDALLASQTV